MKVYFDIEADEFYQEIPFIRSFSFFMLKHRNISCRNSIPRFLNIFIAISYKICENIIKLKFEHLIEYGWTCRL